MNNPPCGQENNLQAMPRGKVDMELRMKTKLIQKRKILLFSILNGIYPINTKIMHKICSEYGKVTNLIYKSITYYQVIISS